ncbi:ribonuclease h [Pyrenophora seminiperda CCB06]|uniref:Ribonuclease h n=1 Tax=Pyrenophora seminiperda CCB06 TaxID=1302712 RepID=A0A3M7MBW3_9PLEO|nr:ribonuclease h [Pyrenophora seminiperda CCB06]
MTSLFPPSRSSSSSSSQSLDRVWDWLRASPDPALTASPLPPPTPRKSPATSPTRSLKRLRAASRYDIDNDNTPRSSSRTKRRRKHDDSLSEQSASRTGSIVLYDRTVLTAISSAKRTSSPGRDLILLRNARPSISLSSMTMLPKPLSEEAMTRLGQLRGQLGSALKGGYIPGGLRDAIEQDPEFQSSLSMQPIDEEAFDHTDRRTLADFALADTLKQVKNIFQSATLCAEFGRDENAWCFNVVWPLMELAIKLHGGNKWRPESVQSQSINPLYLSRISDPSAPSKERHLFRKTDFCFSYSYLDQHFRALYKQLEGASAIDVSHTMDNFTSRAVLFSGIEVKPENGDRNEAELQMGIWMAASLRKKMELARGAFIGTPGSGSESNSTFAVGHDSNEIQNPNINEDDPSVTALLEPALTIIGHEHNIYYAYPTSATGDITILGPDEKFGNLSTRSVQGIFKLISFYATILDYGYRVEMNSGHDSNGGPWGDYLEKIITNMSSGIHR